MAWTIAGLRRPDAGGVFEVEFFDRHLAHLVLLDLAGDRHREGVAEAPVLGHLVVGDLAVAELTQLLDRHALTGPQEFIGEMVTAWDRRRRFVSEGLSAIKGFRCPPPEGASP